MLKAMQTISAESYLASDSAAPPLKARVLIADPDSHTCQILRNFFEQHGADVRVTKQQQEVSGLARVWQPNVILLGSVFCENKANTIPHIFDDLRTRHIPVIVLLNKDEPPLRLALLERGADNTITKPFDMEELRLRVEALIRLSTNI